MDDNELSVAWNALSIEERKGILTTLKFNSEEIESQSQNRWDDINSNVKNEIKIRGKEHKESMTQ